MFRRVAGHHDLLVGHFDHDVDAIQVALVVSAVGSFDGHSGAEDLVVELLELLRLVTDVRLGGVGLVDISPGDLGIHLGFLDRIFGRSSPLYEGGGSDWNTLNYLGNL